MGGPRVWAAPVASGVLLAATGVMRVGGDLSTEHFVSDILPNVVLALVLPLLGAVVLAQLPGHLLGRLWVATGLAGALTLAIHSYAELATRSASDRLPFAVPTAWTSCPAARSPSGRRGWRSWCAPDSTEAG